jgi:hypothetical protein
MKRTECPDTRDGLSAQAAADTLSLFRECPSACPSAEDCRLQVAWQELQLGRRPLADHVSSSVMPLAANTARSTGVASTIRQPAASIGASTYRARTAAPNVTHKGADGSSRTMKASTRSPVVGISMTKPYFPLVALAPRTFRYPVAAWAPPRCGRSRPSSGSNAGPGGYLALAGA